MATLPVGQQVPLTWQEYDPAGGVLPPVGPVAWLVDNTAAATITPSADTFTATLTAVAPGVVNISGVDQGNNLSAAASDTVTDLAVRAAIIIGTPIPVPAAAAVKR